MQDLAAAVEATAIAAHLRGDRWTYPLVNAGHVLGIALLVGAIAPLVPRTLGMPMPPLLRGGEVAVRPLSLQGQDLYLASLGGNVARDALLAHSTKGVKRILGAN